MKHILLLVFLVITINSTYPETSVEYLDLAEIHLGEYRYDEALIAVREALKITPNSARVYLYLGIIYFLYIHDYNTSREYLNHTIELDSTYAEAYLMLGNLHGHLKDYGRALEYYNLAIYYDPANHRYYGARAYLFLLRGEHEKAILDNSEAIKLCNEYNSYFTNRGLSYAILGRDSEALPDFTRAIQIAPNNFLPYFYRAVVYTNSGEHDKALADITTALELNAFHKQAYQLRAVIYQRLAAQADSPTQAGYYLDCARIDEAAANRLDGQSQ